MRSFSKNSWAGLHHFNPSSHHRVGVTGRSEAELITIASNFTNSVSPFCLPSIAYPPLSMQKHCSHEMSIEQLERDERCEDNPKLRMMHAEVR